MRHDNSTTEGAVCVFNEGSTNELNVVSLLNNILHKYTSGFQQAPAPSDTYWKSKGKASFNDSPFTTVLRTKEFSEKLRGTANKYRHQASQDVWANKTTGMRLLCFCERLTAYANQDALIVTLEDEKSKRRHLPEPVWVFLKGMLPKDMYEDTVCDLINSIMTNLRSDTNTLMTDSDFVSAVKRNLFNMGSKRSTEILEAMPGRLYHALFLGPSDKSLGLTVQPINIYYHGQTIAKTSNSRHLHITHKKLLEKPGKRQGFKSLAIARGSSNSPQQLDSQKEDITILSTIIQKFLHEAGFNMNNSSSETHGSSSKYNENKFHLNIC
ncbi:uncharacterized protein FN964_006014 [Alca torda]